MFKKVFLFNDDISVEDFSRFNYLVCHNGVLKVEKTLAGIFTRWATEKEITKNVRDYENIDRSLLKDGAEDFYFALPKIPFKYLAQIISFFREYADMGNPLEAMACIYWHVYKKEYFIDVPFHNVGCRGIDYVPLMHEHAHLVMQLHSHHYMNPIFSKTDDADHLETGLYAVIGNINLFYPDINIRASCSGNFIYISADYVFESPYMNFNREWLNRVQYLY